MHNWNRRHSLLKSLDVRARIRFATPRPWRTTSTSWRSAARSCQHTLSRPFFPCNRAHHEVNQLASESDSICVSGSQDLKVDISPSPSTMLKHKDLPPLDLANDGSLHSPRANGRRSISFGAASPSSPSFNFVQSPLTAGSKTPTPSPTPTPLRCL